MAGPKVALDDASGLSKVVLTTPKATAEVYLHGAHVTSWTKGGVELLFVSKEAIFKPPKAIRGGIPICWPQFSDLGPLGQHGFARNSTWAVEGGSEDSVTLALSSSEETKKVWDRDFKFTYTVSLNSAGDLEVRSHVANTGAEALSYTFALHSYFRVQDIARGTVEGLQGAEYLDSLQGRIKLKEEPAAVVFNKEVDRIYLGTAGELKVVDAASGLTTTVSKDEHLPDAVVWNPWVEKSKAMGDFGDAEYKEMICVEAGVMGAPVEVPAGATWTAKMTLST